MRCSGSKWHALWLIKWETFIYLPHQKSPRHFTAADVNIFVALSTSERLRDQKLSTDWLQHPWVPFAEWVWWNYRDLRIHKQVHKSYFFQEVLRFHLKNSSTLSMLCSSGSFCRSLISWVGTATFARSSCPCISKQDSYWSNSWDFLMESKSIRQHQTGRQAELASKGNHEVPLHSKPADRSDEVISLLLDSWFCYDQRPHRELLHSVIISLSFYDIKLLQLRKSSQTRALFPPGPYLDTSHHHSGNVGQIKCSNSSRALKQQLFITFTISGVLIDV